MIKIDNDKTVLHKTEQDLRPEKPILYKRVADATAESRKIIDRTREELELKQIVRGNDILVSVLTEQAKYKRIWKIVAVILMISFVAILFVSSRLYMDRENKIEDLAKAKITAQKVEILKKQFVKSSTELKRVQNDLVNSKSELKRAQIEMKNSRSELKNLQSQLADTNQRFKALRERNAKAVKLLDTRLRRLPN